MNNIKLEWLVNNFVSFSEDQEITSALTVSYVETKTMIVEGNTEVDGFIQQIKIEEFFSNILRSKDQQNLLQNLKFGTISVQGEHNFSIKHYRNIKTSFE